MADRQYTQINGERELLREFTGRLKLSFMFFMIVLAGGTAGFYYVADGRYSVVDCLYMTVITVATVGYGEIVDLSGNPAGRLFAMALIFAGMGIILYFVSNVTAFMIDGGIRETFRRKRMRNLISGMSGHYIICGAGSMGLHAVDEFYRTERPAVVIDSDAARVGALKEKYPGVGLITGDASENDVLMNAGIKRAAGIMVCTNNDKDNIVITMTARQLNPELRIVSRCNDIKHSEKIKLAGADAVVTPSFISGLRMASELVRPRVVTFLDRMLRDRNQGLRIEEHVIAEGSGLAGRTMAEIRPHLLLLALRRPGGEYVYNPAGDIRAEAGSTLIYMGTLQDCENLANTLRGQV